MTRTVPPFAPTVVAESEFLANARRKFGEFSDPVLTLMASVFHDREITNLLGNKLMPYVAEHRDFVLFKQLILNGAVAASSHDL